MGVAEAVESGEGEGSGRGDEWCSRRWRCGGQQQEGWREQQKAVAGRAYRAAAAGVAEAAEGADGGVRRGRDDGGNSSRRWMVATGKIEGGYGLWRGRTEVAEATEGGDGGSNRRGGEGRGRCGRRGQQ